jgi:Suppressor of fused protein (SUFU)
VPSDQDSEHSKSGEPTRIHLVADVPRRASDHEAIRAHVEKHLGPVANVMQEVVGDTIRIDVLHVPPTDTRPVHTLVTTGMSDRPMAVPAGTKAPRYLELMMTLPGSWQLGEDVKNDARWAWPIRQLKTLARYPHAHKTWLGWGHTVPNDQPPQPLAPGTKLCGAIIVPSLLVPEEFFELSIAAHSIAFFSAVPLYEEEMRLKQDRGANALFEKLIDAGVKDLVEPKRRNVAKRLFGLF